MQREYVELWVMQMRACDASLSEFDARTKAHAVFGLINSTPYSVGKASSKNVRPLLREMTVGALRIEL